jgi:glycosyltransferase involved in cell wall biosynthesis
MTRILTITSWYPPHHYGGYELSCYDVMTRLADRGHEIRVLCGNERVPGVVNNNSDHEALVSRELRPHLWEATTSRPSLRERVAIERHNHRVLDRHLTKYQPDVVSIWHMVAISMSLVRQLATRDVPLMYVVCDDWLTYGERVDAWMSLFSGALPKRLLGRTVEAATGLATSTGDLGDTGAFCFVSDFTRSRAVASERLYPMSTVVYSGIERRHFPKQPRPSDRSWKGRLLYAGRIDSWKGVDTLIRALTFLPESTLALYGRGGSEQRAGFARLSETLGVSARVTFGSLERYELAARYRDADVVVFPSEWGEPFGLVPLEAMACGTPVVATGVGGSGEFLRDGYNCVLHEPGDAAALAAAVRRLEKDRELRRRIVRGGLHTVAQLDVDELADALERWHVAAAERFVHGRPPDRRLDLPPVTHDNDDPGLARSERA